MNKTRRQRGRAGWLWIWLAMLVAAPVLAADGGLHAFLDHDTVQLGDTVTLNVETTGAMRVGTPDLDALKVDFDILGTSHNTRVDIRNGQRHATSIWAVQLRPRHAGHLRIPALDIGGAHTPVLPLTVKAGDAAHRGGPGYPVFVTVDMDTRTPYVGQQVAMTVRLFYTASIARGSLDMPHDDRVELQQLGAGTRYQTRRGGQFYDVLERHYALVPKQAGELRLAPVVFQGMTRASSGWFGNVQQVSALSKALDIAVRDKPADAGGDTWLPARSVTLRLDGVPDDLRAEVGQPLTLTLAETARGLAFEVLPQPALPSLHGADVYPDPSQDDTGHAGKWLEGTRERTFTVVPRRPGELVLPALTLSWWDVDKHALRTARVPAHTLEVAAANDAGVVSASSAAPPSVPGATPGKRAAKPVGVATNAAPRTDWWPWVAAGLGVLWLLTVVVAVGLWRRRARRHACAPEPAARGSARPSPRAARRAFMASLHDADNAGRCHALLHWARVERPDVVSLAGLARMLDDAEQVRLIGALQAARYGIHMQAPGAAALREAFAGGLRWQPQHRRRRDAAALPPLYPDR